MKCMTLLFAAMMMSWCAIADTEVVDGITWTYTVNDGEASVKGGSWGPPAIPASTTGAISVPSMLGGYRVTKIGYNAFRGCSGLTSVTIPDSVVIIGSAAFYGCSGLKSVTIPSSVNSIANIAFRGCSGLTSVTIPNSVEIIDSSAFYGCSALTSMTIPACVTRLSSTFPSVYQSITNVIISEGVIRIRENAFYGCSGLTSVTIPSSVTSVDDNAFSDCGALTSVTIPACVTRLSTTFPSAYQTITNVVLLEGVTSIGDCAFRDCIGLKNVTIPSSVTSIGWGAFSGCSGLKSVTIPSSVTSIGGSAFSGCRALISFVVNANNPTYKSVNDLLLSNDGTKLISGVNGDVSIPEGVTNIDYCAFFGCSGLTSVTIPKSVTSIGADAFYACESLSIVYAKRGDTNRVRKLLEDSGFDTAQVRFAVIGSTPMFEVVAGMKFDEYVGFENYKATGLPKGLTYNARTGKVTGTTKVAAGEYEVKFTKSGEDDVEMTFMVREEDEPTLVCEGLADGTMFVGVAGGGRGAAALPIDIGAESGVKSVTAKNLPTGMRLVQDKNTKAWSITGAATKTGPFKVVLTLTTVAGKKVEKNFTVNVSALPSSVVGTFNGFVTWSNLDNPDGKTFGTVQVATTDAGKITAKVVTAAKTYSFSASAWDEVDGDAYKVGMTLKSGETLELALSSTAGWDDHQLGGNFHFKDMPTDGTSYAISAQKNAFGKTWYFAAEGKETEGWTLSYAENAKSADLTVSLNADGKTSIAGKVGNLKVSASGFADVSGVTDGAIIADFAPVVTISGKKTLLVIRTNLWFDRSNEHTDIGSVGF